MYVPNLSTIGPVVAELYKVTNRSLGQGCGVDDFLATPTPARHQLRLRAFIGGRKPMIPNFKVSGQPLTSEVRSTMHSGPLEMTVFGSL